MRAVLVVFGTRLFVHGEEQEQEEEREGNLMLPLQINQGLVTRIRPV